MQLAMPAREGQDDAELREPAGVITSESVPVQPIEVIVSEVQVRPAVAEKVPRDDQDRVAHGHDAFFVAAPARDPVILRREVAVASSDGACPWPKPRPIPREDPKRTPRA